MSSPARLLLIGLSSALFAANVTVAQKLNTKRPSVSITFKEFIEKTQGAYTSQGARLLLHNNTRWPIYYSKDYDPIVEGAQVIYIIERADGCQEIRKHVDVVMRFNKLPPGRTLSFVVPRGDFLKDGVVYIEFHFSWELHGGETVRREALHRAYFISNDLPPWPK